MLLSPNSYGRGSTRYCSMVSGGEWTARGSYSQHVSYTWHVPVFLFGHLWASWASADMTRATASNGVDCG